MRAADPINGNTAGTGDLATGAYSDAGGSLGGFRRTARSLQTRRFRPAEHKKAKGQDRPCSVPRERRRLRESYRENSRSNVSYRRSAIPQATANPISNQNGGCGKGDRNL